MRGEMEELSRCMSWGEQHLFLASVYPTLFSPSVRQGFAKNKKVFTAEHAKAAVSTGDANVEVPKLKAQRERALPGQVN